MKRQNIRKALLLISFLLFPVTIYYLSPYVIIQAASENIAAGSFVVFVSMFAASLLFGRLFCGWVCPAGGLMECCRLASDKKAKGGRKNWIKYFIWVPWILTVVMMFVSSGGIKKVDPLYLTDHGISVAAPKAYIIYYAVVALIVILAFTAGRRSFCHYVCWMAPFMILGSKIKNVLRYPSLHIEGESSKCINCKQCSKKCPMSLEVDEMVQKGKMYNDECILCGECIDTCPKGAISYSFKHGKKVT